MDASLEALAMAGADHVDCSVYFDEDDDCLVPQHLLASDEDDDCLFSQHLFSQHLLPSNKLVGVVDESDEDVDDSSSESRRVCSREEIKASDEDDESSSESIRGCNGEEIEASDGDDDDDSSENRRGCKGEEIKASDEVDDSSSESRQGCNEEEIKARLALWAKAVASSIREKFN